MYSVLETVHTKVGAHTVTPEALIWKPVVGVAVMITGAIVATRL